MQTLTSQDKVLHQVRVSEPNSDAFADRIDLIINSVGGNSEFARKCGASESVVRSWRKGDSDPSRKRLIAIAEAFDVSLVWLATGTGEMRPDTSKAQRLQNSDLAPPLALQASAEVKTASLGCEEQVQEDETGAEWDNFALVPVYDVQASAGHGSHVKSEIQTGQLAFKKAWLREKGLEVGHLAIITAKGDSMETTICDGDTLLVDTRVDKIIDDSIYIVQADHHLIVKRLQQDFDGSIFAISDNPRYEKRHLNPDQAKALKIAGRVCWYGHEI